MREVALRDGEDAVHRHVEHGNYGGHYSMAWLKSGFYIEDEEGTMTTCEWPDGCTAAPTHTVEITFPEGVHESWQVCRAHDRALKVQVVHSRLNASPPAGPPPSRGEVQCGQCHRPLDESPSLLDVKRQPCPDCGSLRRLHKITATETQTVHESLRVRRKATGAKGGWMTDLRTGDDYSRVLEGWGSLVREKDRGRNFYREAITLPDGTLLECSARLTDHHD